MFDILIDTCGWLDLAKDTRQTAVVGVVEEMVKHQLVSLIVPRLVKGPPAAARRRQDRRQQAADVRQHLKG